MTTEPLDVFSSTSNAAVVRAPGRRFPGVVVQGDTLSTLVALAASVAESCEDEEAAELHDLLAGLLTHYERVLDEHNLPLPFSREDR